jgi:hypothetical protein
MATVLEERLAAAVGPGRTPALWTPRSAVSSYPA